MNSLIIPPSPAWYQPSNLTCTLDNTVIYGARNDIVIIYHLNDSQTPDEVKMIYRAHVQKVKSVSVNKDWGQPNKLLVTVGDDKLVKLWDGDTLKNKLSHNDHLTHDSVIGATFAGNERVISVSDKGTVVIWNLNLNETKTLVEFLGTKATVTCLSTCPHATWLTAFGLKNGLVVVADLRKNGKILYKLRGHDKSVVSLEWCPAPINIFPKGPNNFVGVNKDKIEFDSNSIQKKNGVCIENSKAANSSLESEHENEPNLILKDDLQTDSSQADDSGDCDFLAECDALKNDIIKKISEKEKEQEQDLNKIELVDIASKNDKSETENIIEKKQESEEDPIKSPLVDFEEAKNVDSETLKEPLESVQNKSNDPIPLEEKPRKEFLLASSAREGRIYIWRAGTDGRMQTFLNLPNKCNYRKSSKNLQDNIWISLCWLTPSKLLSSSKIGELLEWTLPRPNGKGNQFSLIHHDHKSTIFSIAGPIAYLNESNWMDKSVNNVWTVGQDRLLLNASVSKDRTNLACYPTMGGAPSCISSSPLDPNRLAIGTSDAFIKVWDLSRPHVKYIHMSVFYQKIQSKVTALAWHPVQETLLAYGTLEGRIGCLDPGNKSKMPTLMADFFKSQIHKVEWGPLPENDGEFGLFAVADGSLVIFDAKKNDKDPKLLDVPDCSYVYSFAWKPDHSLLFVALKNGSVIKYSRSLEIQKIYYLEQKIQSICWHPDAVGSDVSVSKKCFTFAAISNSKTLVVCDFNAEIDEKGFKIVARYQYQSEVINCVSWSPHDSDLLVFGRDDGVMQVWNMQTQKVLASYHRPCFDNLSIAFWSPVHQDFILSGGTDQSIHIWNLNDYPPKEENELSDLKKKFKDMKKPSTVEKHLDSKPKKNNKNNLLPSFYNPKSTEQFVTDLKSLLNKRENLDSDDEIENKDCGLLKIFGSQNDMLEIINQNETAHKKRGKYHLASTLSLFKGDISETVKQAIEKKTVTPFIITLAPLVSSKVWQTACEVYANQLSEIAESDPNEIAAYYLACHKVEEAINVLCENSCFREALSLAKSRLTETDQIITDIVEKWAKHSFMTGNFETAAQCHVFLGKYEDAASDLFRRNEVEVLELAVELAEKSKNEGLFKAVLSRYNAFKEEKDRKVEENKLPSKFDVVLKSDNANTFLSKLDNNNLVMFTENNKLNLSDDINIEEKENCDNVEIKSGD